MKRNTGIDEEANNGDSGLAGERVTTRTVDDFYVHIVRRVI